MRDGTVAGALTNQDSTQGLRRLSLGSSAKL